MSSTQNQGHCKIRHVLLCDYTNQQVHNETRDEVKRNANENDTKDKSIAVNELIVQSSRILGVNSNEGELARIGNINQTEQRLNDSHLTKNTTVQHPSQYSYSYSPHHQRHQNRNHFYPTFTYHHYPPANQGFHSFHMSAYPPPNPGFHYRQHMNYYHHPQYPYSNYHNQYSYLPAGSWNQHNMLPNQQYQTNTSPTCNRQPPTNFYSMGQHPMQNQKVDDKNSNMAHPTQVTAPSKKQIIDIAAVPLAHTLTISCCNDNLNPAPIPINPLNNIEQQTPSSIKHELAWLVEETVFLLPTTKDEILFDLAWLFGSLDLRKLLYKTHLNLVVQRLHSQNTTKLCSETVLGVHQILPCQIDDIHFQQLRKEACEGLNLGYRRSDSLGDILDKVRRFRLRRALEERGDHEDQVLTLGKMRRKRRRRVNQLKPTSDIVNIPGDQLNIMAADKPLEINDIEEEIAWLIEESLLLTPNNVHVHISKPKELLMSAGLVTAAPDVDWSYVIEHASNSLKTELQNIRGGLSNRSLQKIVRYSKNDVRAAFNKRREVIAKLITIGGYRRVNTAKALPSKEDLILTGLFEILQAKLMRRMQQRSKIDDAATTRDLRVACNQRLSDEPTKQKSALGKRLSASNKRRNEEVLTQDEEELAWLREECEIDTNVKGYDWEYIEMYATTRLRQTMMQRGALLSVFPTVPGTSRLKTLVRLNDKRVRDAYHHKRRDIKWAIMNGHRRDRGKDELPSAPSAPAKVVGTRVLDIETCDFGIDPLHSKRDSKFVSLSLIEKYPVKGRLILQIISSLKTKLNDLTVSNNGLWFEEGELGGTSEDVERDHHGINPDTADSTNDQVTYDGTLISIGGKDENNVFGPDASEDAALDLDNKYEDALEKDSDTEESEGPHSNVASICDSRDDDSSDDQDEEFVMEESDTEDD